MPSSTPTSRSRRADAPGPPRARLLISIHIPKTAGSRLGVILSRKYRDRCAFYYGAEDPRTHSLLKVPAAQIDAERLDALAAAGVAVLHGHIKARDLLEAVPDPAQYMTFVREPLNHAISRHQFLRRLEAEGSRARGRHGGTPEALGDYIAQKPAQNFQSGYLEGLALGELRLLGLTENFARSLALVGLRDVSVRGNVNEAKTLIDAAAREALIPSLQLDLALYSYAVELTMRRLLAAERGSEWTRLIRRLARR